MARVVDYDDSPARAHDVLAVADVEALLAAGGRPVARDPGRVNHLLTRVLATMRDHERQVGTLRRDVETIAAAGRRKGTPMQVAVDALSVLTDMQREQVLDVVVSTRLAELQERIDDAERSRLAARSDANRVRFLLERLAGDPALPAPVAASVAEALAALPVPVRQAAPATAPPTPPVPAVGGGGPFVAPWAVPAGGGSFRGVQTPAAGEGAPQLTGEAGAVAAPAGPVTFAVLDPTAEEEGWQVQVFCGTTCAGSVDVHGSQEAGWVASGLVVDDHARRRGLGSALVDEVRRRFPDVVPEPGAAGSEHPFLAAYRQRTGWSA